ncbi:MAG TPA: ECF-type sigma factor [Rhodanobacteraceae bacterium]|nr:ECF-type sigma factor [Rhodanobacteraceae bacterium]
MSAAGNTSAPDSGAKAETGEITRLLVAARAGDSQAERELAPAIYRELHALAHRQMALARPGSALQTTALLHEAWLRVVGSGVEFPHRNQFFAYASTAMRNIVMDDARRRLAHKRGGGAVHLSLTVEIAADNDDPEQMLLLDEVLDLLQRLDPRLLQVVELRVFGGLSVEETGQALGLSDRTIKRDWRRARAFIGERMGQAAG